MKHENHIVYPDADENMKSVFVGDRLARLENLGNFNPYYGDRPTNDEFIERIGDANAVLSGWGLNNDVLRTCSNLEIVSFTGLGVSTFIDLKEAARLGITVTHTLSTAETVAEHTMALMLAATRNIARLDREIRAGHWNGELQGTDLRGKTLGLVGFGRIAQFVLPLARAFGMRVMVWTHSPDAERTERFGVEFCELNELVAESDIVSLHLAYNPNTEGLITAELLRKTRPGVVIVNTARAQIVDETALIQLLTSGHIACAGLDVFNQEPLPQNHPLTRLENVVLTPHSGYNTAEAGVAIVDMAIDNLEAYFSGNPGNVAN
jgi:D-3-phosphoglycerate dehydrogenase